MSFPRCSRAGICFSVAGGRRCADSSFDIELRRGCVSFELENAIFEAAEPHGEKIEEIVLPNEPRTLRRLLGQAGVGARDVPGIEPEQRPFLKRRRIANRFANTILFARHARNQPAHKQRNKVRAKCPRSIGVANTKSKIWNVAEQAAFIDKGVTRIHRQAVHVEARRAKNKQLQARRGNNDIRIELLAGLQADSMFREGFDLIGNDGRFSFANCLKKIRVRHKAKTLVPRFIFRMEVFFYIETLR